MASSAKSAIVFIAGVWGHKHGGINSFNFDLCINIAQTLDNQANVICIASKATEMAKRIAEKFKIQLIIVESSNGNDDIPLSAHYEIKFKIQELKLDSIMCWIGHDIKTGTLANQCASALGGKSAIIHHYSYLNYAGLKHQEGIKAINTNQKQAEVLKNANIRFAIGPKLLHSAEDLLADELEPNIIQLNPGLADITPITRPPHAFKPIFIGRISPEDNSIKQYELCYQALSLFNSNHRKKINTDLTPLFIGYSEKSCIESSQHYLSRLSKEKINFLKVEYLQDRDLLLKVLSNCSLCFMPSFHEGFGLSAWDAIAAGIPLIISKNSGVYQLVLEALPYQADELLHSIFIKGDYETNHAYSTDVQTLLEAVSYICYDIKKQKQKALKLRELLLKSGFTWKNTAKQFLQAIDIDKKTIPLQGVLPKPNNYESKWELFSPFFPVIGFKKSEPLLRNIVRKFGYVTTESTYNGNNYCYQLNDQISLYWFRFGVAVWRITTNNSYKHIFDFAIHREKIYNQLLKKCSHEIRLMTDELIQSIHRQFKASRISPFTSSLGYAFSIINLNNIPYKNSFYKNILKLFSQPSLLYNHWHNGINDHDDEFLKSLWKIEQDYINGKADIGKTASFDAGNELNGQASWSGIAMLQKNSHPERIEQLISLELYLQAYWWYFQHARKLIDQGNSNFIQNHLAKYEVDKHYDNFTHIGETDSTLICDFKDAIIETSKINKIYNSFIKATREKSHV